MESARDIPAQPPKTIALEAEPTHRQTRDKTAKKEKDECVRRSLGLLVVGVEAEVVKDLAFKKQRIRMIHLWNDIE